MVLLQQELCSINICYEIINKEFLNSLKQHRTYTKDVKADKTLS